MKKKFIFDYLLNIIASILPTIILQLIVYPSVSKNDVDGTYGMMVTMVSLLMVISFGLGNVLNNIRLLEEENYKKNGLKGDFNFILSMEIIANVILLGIVLVFVYSLSVPHILLIMLTGLFILLYSYFTVSFRIILNYKLIVVSSLFQMIGYLGGYLIYVKSGYWEWIYLAGYGLALMFVMLKCSLWKEGFKRTKMFPNTLKRMGGLLAASVLRNLLNYSDKLILYPLIGEDAVSFYYIASIFGKIISMAVSPLNSVILSYISKTDKLSKKINLCILTIPVFGAIVGYGGCMLIAKMLLSILYPAYAERAMEYMPITTAIAMISMLISFYHPFVLKTCNMLWQVVIDGGTLFVYVFAGVMLYHLFDLKGFCCGVLLAYFLKNIIMIALYSIKVFKKGK